MDQPIGPAARWQHSCALENSLGEVYLPRPVPASRSPFTPRIASLMRSVKEGFLILLLPLSLGLGAMLLTVVKYPLSAEPAGLAATYQFTVWGDSSQAGLRPRYLIHLSERERVRASLVVVNNAAGQLPLGSLAGQRPHVLVIGAPLPAFTRQLRAYTELSEQVVPHLAETPPHLPAGIRPLIVALHGQTEARYRLRAWLQSLPASLPVVVVNFGPETSLQALAQQPSLVQVPDDRALSQELAAQLLFGGIRARARLRPELAQTLGLGPGFQIDPVRLGYADPAYMGMNPDSLAEIARIVREGIAAYAMPGCQVLVAHRGQVVYHQAFGYHTYEQQQPVRLTDLYDIASITKVAATTLAVMKLYDEGQIDLNAPLGTYFRDQTFLATVKPPAPAQPDSLAAAADSLPRLSLPPVPVSLPALPRRRPSRVFDLTLADLLTHHSGLPAGLNTGPYQSYPGSRLYSSHYTEAYTIPVAERLYLRDNVLDSLWNDTKALRPDSGQYRYSCVNMILLQQMVDSLQQRSIAEFLAETFYAPLGLQTICYNPRELFDPERLVPTASDHWRGQLLCGSVHDPTAALLGGISGNAGLFSNAHDLAVLGQLLLNGGTYGGVRYLSEATVAAFTQRQRGHRGYGFDLPPGNAPYFVAPSASLRTYGHTGFTGTCLWVDPEHELVFVFLSNRIHPSVRNYRLNELEIRQRVHQAAYAALGVPRRPIRRPEEPVSPLPAEVEVFAP